MQEDKEEEKKLEEKVVTPQLNELELQEKKDPTIITPTGGEPIPSSGSAKNSK